MQYTPDDFRPTLSLIGLKVLGVFFHWNMNSFNVMFSQQSAYMLDVKCWYSSKAISIDFSEAVGGLFVVHRVYWMSSLL